VARVDQTIVAAVRLCAEGGALVLRGMYVADDRRGQGIGTRLLDSIPAVIGSSDCWCIPYAHLTNFYSRIGFRVHEGEDIPPFLAERQGRYTAGGKKVVVMKMPKGMLSKK
jgi:GNAT superfamily N-acetyltransferase